MNKTLAIVIIFGISPCLVILLLATCTKTPLHPAGCGRVIAKETFISTTSTSFQYTTVSQEKYEYQAILRKTDSTLTYLYLTKSQYDNLSIGQNICYTSNLTPL
jgi:hypothetical protein